MKLESLKLNKFRDHSLKKEQMFMLNGGGTRTPGGTACRVDDQGRTFTFDYAYDAIRDGIEGRTLHGRSNNRLTPDVDCVMDPELHQG